jgi:transcriptional regulator GlxA family with amidase domain
MARERPQKFGHIILPGFALMSYASAVEPLRAANLLAGTELYQWTSFSDGGGPVASSSGALVETANLPSERDDLDTVLVVAGGNPSQWRSPRIDGCLRRLARLGVRIGGVSGGPYMLARAGLLDGYLFTVHWEHAAALREAFPALRPEAARFIADRDRLTCGGGIAPLDMMHALIAERLGDAFARQVSDWFLHTHIDQPSDPQRGSVIERYGVHHPGLAAALAVMETNVSTPLSRPAVAAYAGVSPRHLERLFIRHLGTGFAAQYRRIRLDQARRLLRQSPLSITEVAMATGFSSAAHFSRSYREIFGRSPGMERPG